MKKQTPLDPEPLLDNRTMIRFTAEERGRWLVACRHLSVKLGTHITMSAFLRMAGNALADKVTR